MKRIMQREAESETETENELEREGPGKRERSKAEGREGKMKGRKLQGNKQRGKGCWMLEAYFSVASRRSIVMQRPGNHSSPCLLCRAQNETKCLPTTQGTPRHT